MDRKPEHVKYRPKPIKGCFDRPFPYQVNGACVRTDPHPLFYLAGCLFYLSSECRLISTQNAGHLLITIQKLISLKKYQGKCSNILEMLRQCIMNVI
jgi:hypothetical protein